MIHSYVFMYSFYIWNEYACCVLMLFLFLSLIPVLQDRRFSDEIDKLTGYKTKSLLCMPIRSSDGEVIGVAQAINKSSSGALFTADDEKVMSVLYCWYEH